MAAFRDSFHFLGRFLRNPTSVGAIAPSSRFLARAIAGDLPLQAGDVVLEYGPGTGPMTAVLAPQIQDGVRYLGVELEQGFHDKLVARYPQLDFHHGSVADIEQILVARDLPKAKYIVSGLPFASLPAAIQKAVLDGIQKVLSEDGEFRTFQYVHAYGLPAAKRFRRWMDERFSESKRSRAVIRNVPPAFVLTYRS